MNKLLLILCASSIVVLSCNKDKFNTKPTLTFKDVNTKRVVRNQDLKFTLQVTDAEGDLTDSIFVFKRTRNCNQSFSNNKFKIPVFPTNKNIDATIVVAYTYGLGGTYPSLDEPMCINRNDSCVYRFVIRDKAGNKSDTITSPEVVIVR